MLDALDPAAALLLAVGRLQTDGSVVTEAVRRIDDWSSTVALIRRHGLLPLFSNRVSGADVPRDIARSVIVARLGSDQRKAMLSRELVRIFDALIERGIPATAFKGPVIAHRVYGDLSLREYSDLDVLVDRQSLTVVEALLRQVGFRRTEYSDSANHRQNRRNNFEETWIGGDGVILDLHWRVADQRFPVAIATADLLSRAVDHHLPAGRVRTFCDEDHLIILAAHAAKHSWSRLEWVSTIGEMAQRNLDWDVIVDRANGGRCTHALAISCRLAERLLGYEYPSALDRLLIRRRDVEIVSETVAHQTLSLSATRSGWPDALLLRRFDRRRDAAKSLVLGIVEPRSADARVMSIPERFWLLYYFMRPLRLALKYAAVGIRHLTGPRMTPQEGGGGHVQRQTE